MRVGLIIYGSLSTLSGGYLYDRKLVETLRSQGDSVEIVSFPWKTYPGHLLQNFEPGLRSAIQSKPVDIWLQDELNHPSLFWMNRALRRPGFPPIVSIVHHLRGSEDHSPLAGWLYRQVERAYLNSVDAFVFNSQTTRQVVLQVVMQVIGRVPRAIVATPAGDRLGPGISPEELQRRSTAPGSVRILFVGNLIRRKGLDTLLRGLAQIKTDSWTLRVVGKQDVDPAYTREVFRLVQQQGLTGRVQFLGDLSDPALRQEFLSAQVLAVISSYEGFGIVYLEGMGFGLPAIASTGGAARELVEPEQNGCLVDPGDAAGVAEAVRRYCRDRSLLFAHSQAARQRFDHFPGWEKTAACIRDFLVQLCAR